MDALEGHVEQREEESECGDVDDASELRVELGGSLLTRDIDGNIHVGGDTHNNEDLTCQCTAGLMLGVMILLLLLGAVSGFVGASILKWYTGDAALFKKWVIVKASAIGAPLSGFVMMCLVNTKMTYDISNNNDSSLNVLSKGALAVQSTVTVSSGAALGFMIAEALDREHMGQVTLGATAAAAAVGVFVIVVSLLLIDCGRKTCRHADQAEIPSDQSLRASLTIPLGDGTSVPAVT